VAVKTTKAEGQQRIIVNEVKADTVTAINNARTYGQGLKIKTNQEADVLKINSDKELIQAQSKYTALVLECKAEESNLEGINAQREHDYQMAKARAYEILAKGGSTQIVMSGSSGENLINKIF
jgi:hypothetical protein